MHLAISRAQAAIPPMPLTASHTLSPCTKGHFFLSLNTCLELGWNKHPFISPSLRGYSSKSTPCKRLPVFWISFTFCLPRLELESSHRWNLSLETLVLTPALTGLGDPFQPGLHMHSLNRGRAAGEEFLQARGPLHPSFPSPITLPVPTSAGSRHSRVAIRLLLIALVVFHV